MESSEKVHIESNASYISANLLDELDYIIGGYGKANEVFVFTLNTFLEAFVLSSHFYTSMQEMRHMSVISKSLFPNGRPVSEMLSKTGDLSAVGGIGNEIAQVVSIIKIVMNDPNTYQKRIHQFMETGIDYEEAKAKYLHISEVNSNQEKFKYLNIGRVDDGFVATESSYSPISFYTDFTKISSTNNLQGVLPFYSFEKYMQVLEGRGVSQTVLDNLSALLNADIGKITDFIGYEYQSIPPLVNIVLSQCRSLDDLPGKMLALRNDFTHLRSSVVGFEKRIHQADSIKQQISALDEFNEFWTTFNKKYGENRRLLYRFWDVVDGSKLDEGVSKSIKSEDFNKLFEEINLGKILGKGAQKALDFYKEKKILNRFSGVTDLWHRFENTPNIKNQISEFERVFKVSFSNNTLKSLHNKISSITITKNKS